MAKLEHKRLRPALEDWARWCVAGQPVSAGRTMLAKLIDNKGEMLYGSCSGSTEPPESRECRIEARVLAMAAGPAPLCADVLRLEFDAGWWQVCARRGIRHYDPRGIGRFEKALALGISLATYKRRLFEALNEIEECLK
ncbi:hypothetical protein V0R55_24685 [Pseudomonas soli]|uniref:Phage antitermination protein Q n=1 Tax=Pseudomonas soli TaxID=1306993 RepID=A0ABU7GWK0_9PSED|nr:hypothetical protein [Pseudomonas soli]MEE1883365.1 hypothetical protein [Pseudomonas soli]